MVKSLSITQAREQLMKLADEMEHAPGAEPITITKHGHPVMTVLSSETYETLVETLAILSDRELTEALRRGIEDVSAGRVHDLDDVFAELGW